MLVLVAVCRAAQVTPALDPARWAMSLLSAAACAQEVVELARDKESLLMLVAACKEAQGAHLDLVREQLYDSHLRAVAAQVSHFVGWLPAAARWGLHASVTQGLLMLSCC